MRAIERRIAGLALAGSLIAAGCGVRQVGETNLVDCNNGANSGEATRPLQKGESLYIGGYTGFMGEWFRQPLKLRSDGDGDIVANITGVGVSNSEKNRVRIPSDPDMPISAGGIDVESDHGIIFDSNDIDFTIKGFDQDGVTQVSIQAECRK